MKVGNLDVDVAPCWGDTETAAMSGIDMMVKMER